MRRLYLFGALLAAGPVACGGDLVVPGGGDPATISVVSGNDQSGRVGERLPRPLVVQVSDAESRPVPGATVEISLAGAPDSIRTGDDGRGSIAVALGQTVGRSTGHARVVAPTGPNPVETTFIATAVSASANSLAGVSGDGQTGLAGAPLAAALVVEVTDAFGNPVTGADISWSADGGGSLSEALSRTGADGRASVTWTLGTAAGGQTASATSGGLAGSPVVFSATATSGTAASLTIVSGNGQSAAAGAALPAPLVVAVADSDGNPVEGAAVSWVVTGGGGSLDPSSTLTGPDGRASTTWTLGATPGPVNTAQAVLSGVGQVEFTATGTGTGAGSALGIRTEPSANATLGEVFGRQPIVELRDAAGHRVPQGGVQVTAAIQLGPGRLDGTTTRATGPDGRVQFPNLSISQAPGDHTLIFAALGFTSVVSAHINVTPPVNQTPDANNDSFSTAAGQTLDIPAPGVLGNDNDPEGATLTAQLGTGPSNAAAFALNGDGSFTYTPATGFSGDDHFTYTASDGNSSSAEATVTITVAAPPNTPPSFTPGSDQAVSAAASASGVTVSGWATNISPGSALESGQTVHFNVTVEAGKEGLFQVAPAIAPDGTLTYTPAPTLSQVAVFATVVAQDDGGTANGGQDSSAAHTLNFTIDP